MIHSYIRDIPIEAPEWIAENHERLRQWLHDEEEGIVSTELVDLLPAAIWKLISISLGVKKIEVF